MELGLSNCVRNMQSGSEEQRMNTDIRLSIGFWQHPKTKKTARRIGLEGIRSLQVLWMWAAQNRPNGSLSGMDWEDIELAADWQGEERQFFDTCLGMWIDETPEGYALHDWTEHNSWAAEADDRSDRARFSRLATVNRTAFDILKSSGINAVSKEEYERLTSVKRTTSDVMTNDERRHDDRPTTVSESSDDRPTTVNDSSNDRLTTAGETPTPAPSPALRIYRECVLNARTQVANNVPESPLKNKPEGKNRKSLEMRQPSLAFDQFFEAYPEAFRGGRLDAEREWVTLEARRALPGLPRILDTLTQWENSEGWKQEGGRYIPSAANFLKREYWQRKPQESLKPPEHCGRDKVAASGCFDRPQANTVAQRRMQDYDDMAKMLLRARRSGHAYDKHDASIAGQSGPALPAGGQNPCTVADSGRRLG